MRAKFALVLVLLGGVILIGGILIGGAAQFAAGPAPALTAESLRMQF